MAPVDLAPGEFFVVGDNRSMKIENHDLGRVTPPHRRKAAVLSMRVAILGLILAAAIACGDSDERAIRNQMSAIAESLSAPENDGELGRVARIAALRKVLAPDIAVSTGVPDRPARRFHRSLAATRCWRSSAAGWRRPVESLSSS